MLSELEIEKQYFSQDHKLIAGIDEAGRGPLAGPVVAACVAIGEGDMEKIATSKEFSWVKDSKKISEKRRVELAKLIRENFAVGVGVCHSETIDRMNILQATFLAMKLAINDCHKKADIYLVDGKMALPNFSAPQKAIIDGDALVFVIAASSIIAKTERDEMMKDLHEKYPQYGFDKHKGYGTKVHLEALKKFGASEVHRKSFAPVAKVV